MKQSNVLVLVAAYGNWQLVPKLWASRRPNLTVAMWRQNAVVMFVMFLLLQPALLYLVPACIGTPLLIACLKGEVGVMFKYVYKTFAAEFIFLYVRQRVVLSVRRKGHV